MLTNCSDWQRIFDAAIVQGYTQVSNPQGYKVSKNVELAGLIKFVFFFLKLIYEEKNAM
jgi:hypothetical protein